MSHIITILALKDDTKPNKKGARYAPFFYLVWFYLGFSLRTNGIQEHQGYHRNILQGSFYP